MRCLLLALLLQVPPGQPTPQKTYWVVSFQHTGDDRPNPTITNIRLLVWASSEGDAVLSAMKRLRKVMDENFCESLQYLEAQPK
jgi:hypothetical protein